MINLTDLYSVEDPVTLFALSTDAINERQESIDEFALVRARAIAALYAQGYSYRELATSLGISAPRVGQLVGANDTAELAVLKAWVGIERQLQEVLRREDISPAGSTTEAAIEVLRHSGSFDQQALVDLDAVRHLRNHLVHGRTTVSEDAAETTLDKAIHVNALLTLWLHDQSERHHSLDTSTAEPARLRQEGNELTTVVVIQRRIAQLRKDEAAVRKQLNAAHMAVAKGRSEAAKKRHQASKTTSSSMTNSYLHAAEVAERKANSEEKKAVGLTKRLSELAAKQATASHQLESARKTAVRTETAADLRRRSADKRHAREVSKIARPTVRHLHEVRKVEPPKAEKLRVLYLTANPDSENFLRVDVEVREVRQAVRKSTHRDLIEINHLPAATPEDLLDGLNDIRPHVVHFSGHGDGTSLLFDDALVEGSVGRTVSFDLLARALAATDHLPKMVILNACDSLEGADELLDAVPVVIAMKSSISDLAATAFAARFYSAIASAQSIQAATKQGSVAVDLLDLEEGWGPQLLTRGDIDVASMALVQPMPT